MQNNILQNLVYTLEGESENFSCFKNNYDRTTVELPVSLQEVVAYNGLHYIGSKFCLIDIRYSSCRDCFKCFIQVKNQF